MKISVLWVSAHASLGLVPMGLMKQPDTQGDSIMYAIEFHTKVKNGSITIPEEYRDQLKGNVRVILVAEESAEKFDMIEYLLANPLNIEGFKPLTRDVPAGGAIVVE